MNIETKTAKSGKIRIYADGEFLFTVNAVLWYSSPFYGKSELTQEDLDLLKAQSEISFAYESALRMLSLRAHSQYEIKNKLLRKFSAEAVTITLEKLIKSGLTDDEKFAVLLAKELYENKAYAPKRIQAELKNRGISGEYIQNAINTLDINEETSIISVIEKLKISEESTEKEKARAVRRLLNMGYSFYDITKYISVYE